MKQELLRKGMLTAWLTAALTGAALAMPSGGTLTQGNVTVDQGSLAAMSSGATIKATEDSVIEWTDFDLAAADELHFDTINGAIINRVPAGKAALLRGKIKQTGTHPLSIISDGSLSADAVRIDGTDVEIAAAKMTMQDSSLLADRLLLRVGAADDMTDGVQVTQGAPLYLSNSIVRAKEFRSISGSVYLLKDSELNADTMNLSIGERIRISYGADGTETHEEIAVTRDNTFSLWDSSANGVHISFRTGGAGIWGNSVLEAEGKITPMFETSNKKNTKYSLTRADGSSPKLLCGENSSVWQKSGGVQGFELAYKEKTPPVVPVER